jgi:magnesium transporter
MIVNCVAYRDGHKVEDLAPERISDALAAPGNMLWVALKDPDDGELDVMKEEFGLPELAVEDARKGHQRPKVEEYADLLFVVMHTVEVVDGELLTGEVAVFVGRNYVLSVRHRTTRGFSGVRARCEVEPDLLRQGPGFVLYALLDAVVDRYFPVIDDLEGRLEEAERRIFKGAPARESVEALYDLKLQLTTIQHAVRPLLESLGKLFGGRVPPACIGLHDYFRDVFDHLQRVNQSIDGLREMVVTAMTVNLSLISLQENETTKRLAAYAALVAVPTLVAGIYGMNFEHMPELKMLHGYPMALALMVIADLYLFYRFRKARWL